jgi:hypothetical protein
MTKKNNKAKKKPTGDYPIGYGKPPVHTRFKPGQSGHPGGRKVGRRNFKTLVLEIFESEIELAENGRKSSRTVAEALLLRLAHAGLKDGDVRAIGKALELYERFADKDEAPEAEALSESDLDIIGRAVHGAAPGDGQGEQESDTEVYEGSDDARPNSPDDDGEG